MSDDQTNDDLDRVKQALKERFSQSDYDELIKFTAELYITNWKRKKEAGDFKQAMLNMRLAKADDNKQTQKLTEETYKDNSLLEVVMRSNFWENKFVRSWRAGNKRHKENKLHKDIVTSDWANDPSRWQDYAEAAEHYYIERKELYDHRTIMTWLKDHAKKKNINAYEVKNN